jgi:outer membrane protein TolC
MNVSPDSKFTLAPPSPLRLHLPTRDSRELVRVALERRPEVRDVIYRQRINLREADAALLELLPGIQLYAGPHYDSNSFLLHDQWKAWGAKASWNLIRLFQYPARRGVIDANDELLDQRALALTMAIMTQIHVGRVRLHNYRQELETAQSHYQTQTELMGHIGAEHRADRVSEQTRLREQLNTLVSEVRLDVARVAVETAKANLIASVGLDPQAESGTLDAIQATGITWRPEIRRTASR